MMINAKQQVLGQEEQVRQPQPEGIRIPVVVKVTAMIFVGLFIVAASLVIGSRSPDVRFDPFAAYASVLPGQPRANAEAYGFECEYPTGSQWEQCLLQPSEGDFSRVWLSVDNGIIASVLFTPRKSTFSVGDLSLVLGVPQNWGAVHYRWNAGHVSAYVPTNAGRFNYQVQILNISVQ
jgi:hypothetical protein